VASTAEHFPGHGSTPEDRLTEAVVAIVIAVTALALLWNDKANAFYATNNP
jgi:beta-glucosidase-like glycosyl hydrolase